MVIAKSFIPISRLGAYGNYTFFYPVLFISHYLFIVLEGEEGADFGINLDPGDQPG